MFFDTKIMKELLYKSIYREIFYHTDKKMLEMNYFATTSNCTDEEYKKGMLITYDFLDKKDVFFYYVNAVNFNYIITPEIQEWLEKTINPVLVKSALKKVAIMISKHRFSRISMQDTVHKLVKVPLKYEIRYFIEEETAMKWLLA
jgi:hypothetical protein